MTPTRPALRWFGGKWRLAPWIIAQFPPHRVYVEPYGGGASVLMRKRRSYAEVYNDLDRHVAGFFAVLRDRPDDLIRAVELTPFARDELELSHALTGDPVEDARRFAVRSFMGFGTSGLAPTATAIFERTGFRSNSNLSGTTPARDWRHYPDALAHVADRLRGVVIENKDALAVMRDHDGPATLHYVDPPYHPDTRTSGSYRCELDGDGHAALLEALQDLRGMVIVSGYAHPLYDQRLASWRRIETRAFADGAQPRIERLWISPSAQGLQLPLEALA